MEKYLKKVKTCNMILLVLEIISVVLGAVGLPKTLKPDVSVYKNTLLGSYGDQLYDYLNSPLTKVVSILGLLLSIFLVICYFKANKRLAEGELVSKFPYYIYLLWAVITLLSAFTMPRPEVGGVIMSITSLVIQLLVSIPAILAIIYLFKAEPGE